MALMKAAGVVITRREDNEPLGDVEFRDRRTNTPIDVMFVDDRNFKGLIPLPLAHAEGARLLLKMKKLRCLLFQRKLTNCRQSATL